MPILPQKWQYLVSASTKKQFGILQKLMHRPDVESIVNSCDSGREGELIFRLVYQQAGCKKPFSRLWLSSMEENAIREGFASLKPSTEYDALYQAALCRERADWMVGINASRLFSCLYGQPLAVGRVMTPVLAMTVVREAAIAAFVPEKFYTVDLELTSGCTASSRRIPEKSVAENLLEACRKEMVATIQRITRKEKSENPPPLYDLTTLQRDANRLLGYSAQQTLDYVQRLYEKKLTTYPRTDSCYITDDDEEKLTHFDCWASTFGETTTAIELAPEGTGYRARTRFAKFFNLPELMSMFKEVADIKTSDQLHLPVPEAKFETVVAKPSEIQKEMVQELSKRAAEIHSGAVDASVDNMLCVTNDGRKIGLDVRLMNPMLPDDPNSKLNVCVQNVLKIWEDGKDQKLTQLLFCDLSTPKNDGNFNVYDDIRKKLVAAGVPENEIEFIHNADTEAKKAALFSKVRSGDVRVLLGSTAKMGAGTNVQSRLVAVHHLDVGWKPSDMTQRNGRIIRQGNMNKEVKVFNYVTEGTFDSYLFQTLENKQRFISQIMTSKSPVRSCDDVDEQALSYAEIKALCAGNPLIKEKMDLDVQVAKLKVLKADHQSQKFRLQDKLLTKFPADIRETNAYIAGVKADAQLAAAHPQVQEGFCGMTIKGVTYDEKKTAGERLVLACSELPNAEEKVIGSYRGFELSLRFDTYRSEYQAILKGQRRYPVPLGTDPLGNIIRLDNSLNNFPERINSAENELATLHQQQAAAQIEVEKPFPEEEELTEKSARLAELNAQLDVDEKSHEPKQDEEEQEDSPRRPSVLAALEEKSDKPEPVKPFRSYYDKDGDAR